ncbi:hypothetical protein [Calidifontibacter terrae]
MRPVEFVSCVVVVGGVVDVDINKRVCVFLRRIIARIVRVERCRQLPDEQHAIVR